MTSTLILLKAQVTQKPGSKVKMDMRGHAINGELQCEKAFGHLLHI
jgi:hypothetical protein